MTIERSSPAVAQRLRAGLAALALLPLVADGVAAAEPRYGAGPASGAGYGPASERSREAIARLFFSLRNIARLKSL